MHKRILSGITIIVLTVSQVLFSFPFNLPAVKEAHAATRLGLHVTQEELNIWRQRKNDNSNSINGSTYQSIWNNRILPDANNFKGQSHPGGNGFWSGWTGGGCYPNQTGGIPQPGRSNGDELMKSAFVYLINGDVSYADPVRTELLNQIAQSATDFGNNSKWCKIGGQIDGNTFDASNWAVKLLHGYDYLLAGGIPDSPIRRRQISSIGSRMPVCIMNIKRRNRSRRICLAAYAITRRITYITSGHVPVVGM